MDLTTTSEIVKIGLVLITFFTIPVYSEYCSGEYCSSCCGSSCCSSFSTVYIVLIVIGCVFALFVCIACYCCRRRRAVQGTVLSNQGPMQHTVFQMNMMPTASGQIMQMQPVQTPGFTGAPSINQQPHFNPVIQPNMGPNPAVSTITSLNAHRNRNLPQQSERNYLTPESSEPPAYEELSRTGREQPLVYDNFRVNSGYEVPVNRNTSDDNGVYAEIPDYSAPHPNYISPI